MVKRESCVLFDLDGTLLSRWSGDPNNPDWTLKPIASPAKIRALGMGVAICSNQGGVAWNLAGGRPGKAYPDFPSILARVAEGMRVAGVRAAFLSLNHPEAMALIRQRDYLHLVSSARWHGIPDPLVQALYMQQDVVFFFPLAAEPETVAQEWVAAPLPIAHELLPPWDRWVAVSWAQDWRKPNGGMLRAARAWFERHYGACDSWIYVGDEEDDRRAAEDAGMAFVPAKEISFGS